VFLPLLSHGKFKNILFVIHSCKKKLQICLFSVGSAIKLFILFVIEKTLEDKYNPHVLQEIGSFYYSTLILITPDTSLGCDLSVAIREIDLFKLD
jgi:hypothetical protein